MITDTRLTQITNKLARLLRAVAGPGYDAEELTQVAVLAILEKESKDPDFASYDDSYIVRAGVWAARDFIRSGQLWANRQVSNSFETSPSPDSSPERAVERRQTLSDLVDAVKRLSPESQILIEMVYAGYSKSDIAARLGVSRSAVSHRRRALARQVGTIL